MNFDLGTGTREDLVRWGETLDRGGDEALELTERVLKIRNRLGRCVGLAANPAQQEYQKRAAQRNIVLKARQMGANDVGRREIFSPDNHCIRDG